MMQSSHGHVFLTMESCYHRIDQGSPVNLLLILQTKIELLCSASQKARHLLKPFRPVPLKGFSHQIVLLTKIKETFPDASTERLCSKRTSGFDAIAIAQILIQKSDRWFGKGHNRRCLIVDSDSSQHRQSTIRSQTGQTHLVYGPEIDFPGITKGSRTDGS